jgi:hypothetical protein
MRGCDTIDAKRHTPVPTRGSHGIAGRNAVTLCSEMSYFKRRRHTRAHIREYRFSTLVQSPCRGAVDFALGGPDLDPGQLWY